MKTLLLPLSAVALLTGCATSPWSNDCATHYSTTAREQSNCLKKVEASRTVDIQPEQVSLDPGNTNRETFDDIGKGGASDSNDAISPTS